MGGFKAAWYIPLFAAFFVLILASNWSGLVPFEIKEINIQKDGFLIHFTEPVDSAVAARTDVYDITTYTHVYHAGYGSPEVDHTTPTISAVEVSDDGLHARLVVSGLMRGHVHELDAKGVRSTGGENLLHSQAYYTLNNLISSNNP